MCTSLPHRTSLFQYMLDTVGTTIHLVCYLQVSPLTEMERILDIEIVEAPHEDSSSTRPGSKKMERYLIKWKGLSYVHCSW